MSEPQEDIVVALRKEAASSRGMEGDYYGEQYATDDSLLDEAADEIERLRKMLRQMGTTPAWMNAADIQQACESMPDFKVNEPIYGFSFRTLPDGFGTKIVAGGWIPVSERLPEWRDEDRPQKTVLLYVDDYGCWITIGRRSQDGWYVVEAAEACGLHPLNRFSHWMPLPEPPSA